MADDFNFDDMDWPDIEFEENDEPSKDRNPVVSAVKQTGRGAKKIIFDGGRIKKTTSKILPKSHSNVAEAGFEAAGIASDLYYDLGSEARKTKEDMQRSLRRFNQQTKGAFGKRIEGFLGKLAGEDNLYSSRESEDERRRREIQDSLASVFGEVEKERIEEKKQAGAKELRREVLDKRRHASTTALLSSIANNIAVVAQHVDLDTRYKRRSLELQMQQSQLLGDLLQGINDLRKESIDELKNIRKNTGLPEAVKITESEEFMRLNKQRMMEKVGSSVFGGLGDYLARQGRSFSKRAMNVTADKLRSLRSGFEGGTSVAGDLIQQQRDNKEMGGEDDTIETIVELLGGMFVDKGINKASPWVQKRLSNMGFFKNSTGKFRNISTQGAQYLNWEAGRRGTRDGLSGGALDFLRSLLDRTTLNTSLGSFSPGDISVLDEQKLQRKALISQTAIMPGLMARVHHELVKIRTGREDMPMIAYDMDTGRFRDKSTMINRVREKIASTSMAESNSRQLDNVVDKTLDTSKLTPDQRDALKDHLIHLNMRGLPWSPRAMAEGSMGILGRGSIKDKEAIRKAISEQYGVNRDGTLKDGVSENDFQNRTADTAAVVHTLRYSFKDPRSEILDLVEKGHSDELIALGVLKDNGGSISIDFDRVSDLRTKTGTDIVGENPAYAPKGMRAMGRGGNTRITRNIHDNRVINNGNLDGFGGDDRYNSQYQSLAMEEIIDKMKDGQYAKDYQSTALEEIIDVLQKGQNMSDKQFAALTEAMNRMVDKKTDSEETYNSQYQTMVLEEIMDILQDGRQVTHSIAADGSVLEGAFTRLKGRLGRGIDYLRKTKPGRMLSDAKGFVKGKMGSAKEFIKGRWAKFGAGFTARKEKLRGRIMGYKDDLVDWYKHGEWRVSLEAKKLAAGKYIDDATGKAVASLKDVKGNILEIMEDGTTQMALTYEDLRNGLRDGRGREFIMKQVGRVKGLFDRVTKRPRELIASAKGMLKKGVNKVKGWLTKLPDVYVLGEKVPRLLAVLAKNGAYFSGGKTVRSFNDIVGDVSDADGIVLSTADMAKGLVDAEGNEIKHEGMAAMLRKVLGTAGNIASGAWKFAKRTARKARIGLRRGMRRVKGLMGSLNIKGMFGSIATSVRNFTKGLIGETTEDEMLNVAYAQLEVQGLILDQVSQLKKRKGKGKWDTDGDGVNDGSWRDLLSRRKKVLSGEEVDALPKEKKENKLIKFLKSAFATIGPVIGSAVGFLATKFMDGIGWLGKILAMSRAGRAIGDIAGGLGDMFGRGGRRGRMPRTPGRIPGGGRLGRAAGAIGDMFMRSGIVSGAGGRGAGVAAGSVIGTMGGTATTAAAGTAAKAVAGGVAKRAVLKTALTWGGRLAMGGLRIAGMANPIGLALTAAWIGYEIYQWAKDKTMFNMRMAQYGVDPSDSSAVERYLEFEEWVWDKTKAKIDGTRDFGQMTTDDILEAMDDTIGNCSDNPEQAMTWFKGRFIPVMNGWTTLLKSMKVDTPLYKIGDKLSDAQNNTIAKKAIGMLGRSITVALPSAEDTTLEPSKVKSIISDAVKSLDKEADGKTVNVGAPPAQAVKTPQKAANDPLSTGQTTEKSGGFFSTVGKLAMRATGIGIAAGVIGKAVEFFSGKTGFADIEVKDEALDPLRSVRMKIYGLDELSTSTVNAILRLELHLADKLTYSGKESARLSMDPKTIANETAGFFGIDMNGSGYSNYVNWLEYRFLPAYVEYMGVAKAAGGNPLLLHKNASKTVQYFSADRMMAASSIYKKKFIAVWQVDLHPVEGNRPNMNPASVKGNMEALLAKVDIGELSEISGEKGGILDRASKAMKRLGGKFLDTIKSAKDKVVNKMGEWYGSAKNSVKNFFGFGSDSKTESSPTAGGDVSIQGGSYGGINHPGGSYTPSMGGGAAVNFDPAGGKYGNVTDVPHPGNVKGFNEHRDLIWKVGEMTGVDPGVLAGLFATESGFNSLAKNPASSATGIGQFLTGKNGHGGTWGEMVKAYGHLFGIKPGTSPNDPRANALMTVMYMKHNRPDLMRFLGREPTDVDYYLAHFLGAKGYEWQYKQPHRYAFQNDPKAARANASIFYFDGEARRQPRTGAQVLALQGNKQVNNRNKYGRLMHDYILSKGGKVNPAALASSSGAEMGEFANGAQSQGSAPSASPSVADASSNLEIPDTLKAPVPKKTSPVLDISPGDGSLLMVKTPKEAVDTVAAVGSDVTKPPISPTSNVSSMVKVKNEESVAERPVDTAVSSPMASDSGRQLLHVNTQQLEVLKIIADGVGRLVANAGQKVTPVPQQQQPRPVNGQVTSSPVNLKRSSSV